MSGSSPAGGPAPLSAAAGTGRHPAIERRLGATPQAVRQTLVDITHTLGERGYSSVDCDGIEAVLAEILNNIVEHAYRGRRDGWIALRLDPVPGAVICRVTDGGAPMPGDTAPRGRPRDLDVAAADLPEGGFGWFLIRELSQQLHYDRTPGQNNLSVRIATGSAP
ncbi:ATP-binding protein [Tropicimonas sp.]|uniref:ATP-binding protein n=1 Tax=Tropicimonas sp. TaxID=2067044 RepID=UPI003A861B3C